MAMTIDQLTIAYNGLAGTVQNLTSQLEGLIPKVQQQAQEADDLAKTLDANLKAAVNPIIEADLVSAVQKADQLIANLDAARAETTQKVRDVEVKLSSITHEVGAVDTLKQFVMTVNSNLEEVTKEVKELKKKAAEEELKTETRYAQQQQQLATMMSTMGASSSVGGQSRSAEPFVVHKLILNKIP